MEEIPKKDDIIMTQDERWMAKYNEVESFIEKNHRTPSKYYNEEKLMVHFLKRNRKLVNAGGMKKDRVELFQKLMELGKRYKRENQYQ